MSTGEEKVWETLTGLDPGEVCRRTDATFDPAEGLYMLKSFGKDFSVSPRERKIFSHSPGGEIFLQRLGYFFRLSITGYLAIAKDVSPTGRLVNPMNMKSGQLFFRGSHVLPLDRVAEKYGNDRDGFLKRGEELGGERLGYGDASMRLLPLSRVAVVPILWTTDDEFPARADLLFDSSCEVQLPIDVIWSIAMLSTLALL
ncbi:MAG: DUF3786 domain-containing protein [Nitrospirae bacterium]|nr:DUF3786 domain-containing protein [Nitrospirota bacterium]MCL5422366.1 DUF3786 domain-containing protein [Nitrospirota bacterium]